MNVPSFASFPDVEEDEAGPSSTSSPSKRHREKPTSVKEKKDKPDKHRKHRHDSDSDRYDQSRTLSPPTSSKDVESKLFYLDRKGDELNITYGGLHSRSVPRYHRVRGVLGLPPRWFASDDFSNADRYIYKSNLVKIPQRLKIGSRSFPGELDADFIPITAHAEDGESSQGSSRSSSPSSANAGLVEPRITQDPSDLSTWHRLLRETASSSPTPKAAADIQLSILSRALQHLPNEPSLLSARARVAASFDTPAQADLYWEDALANAKGVGRGELWKQWLGWVFKAKGLEAGIANIRRAMDACSFESGNVIVDLFSMVCAILHHAGYTERAICAYQALLEVHFFSFDAPQDTPWPEVIQRLETWWDGERARLGESSRQSLPGSHSTSHRSAEQQEDHSDSRDAFCLWLKDEQRFSRTDFLPPSAGTQDDSDPYRVTVFLDIAPLLPTRLLSFSEASLAARDLLGLLGLGVRSSVATEISEAHHPEVWTNMWNDERHAIEDRQTFIRNVLSQLRSKLTGTELDKWDQISIAFEWAVSRKGALKFTKGLLSTSPSSLHLWSLCADMERLSKKPDSSRKVYQTVLFGPETAKSPGALKMWLDWASLEWQEGDLQRAAEILCQSVLGGSGVGPVRLLRARQVLEAQFAAQPRQELLKSRALLVYLTSSTLTDTMAVLHLDKDANEDLHVARAEFLKTLGEYRGGAPVPPTALREPLEESANLFPWNGQLLQIFAWNEKREKVWGRVRRLLETVINKTFDVHLETWAVAVDSDDSISGKREWLDRAVQDDRMRSSVFLWKAYVNFEFDHGKAQKAKSLLYRAVAECPWSKELHVLALSPFVKSIFKAHELNSWMDVMLERRIRLRVEWTGQSEDEDEPDEEENIDHDINEIEKDAIERHRLMPF